MALPKEKKYTAEEFLAFAETNSEPMELIDGEIVYLASPSIIHQRIIGSIHFEIMNYIKSNKGDCIPMLSPFDVRLQDDNVVVPDISVICDKSKLSDGKRCNGSPDWIIEVVSSNWKDDYIRKLHLYEENGVREYWIVDPQRRKTVVYFFEDNNNIINIYDFSQSIPVNIYKNNPVQLSINIDELLK
ncbi:MAG: Uma2 family endonuclease [Oscillospiraceae bacterium]|nr:Uma2 family endonuclease [Oscillospiraceae bacterium]